MELLEIIFNAIFDAEEDYGADNIKIVINDKVSINYNNRTLKSFDTKDLTDSEIIKINDLCEYLNLSVRKAN